MAIDPIIADTTPSPADPSPVAGAWSVASPSDPSSVAPEGTVPTPANPSNAVVPIGVPQITVTTMTISGTVDPDMNGVYYPAGVLNEKTVYTLDGVAYSTNVARIESNNIQWVLESVDFFGDSNGIWTSNDSPHPTTPATATTWTPNESEEGTPVITSGTAVVTDWHVDSIKPAGNNPTASNPSPIIP